jgi:hypothetical protein
MGTQQQSPTEPILNLNGFRGVEDMDLNGVQNYWSKDGSFNLGGGGQGGAPSQVPTNILQQYPLLSQMMQKYGSDGSPQVSPLRSPPVAAPTRPPATLPPTGSGKGAGGKSPMGRNITGAQWNPNSSPNIMQLIQSSMMRQNQ